MENLVRTAIRHYNDFMAEAQLYEFENALHLYEKMQKTENILTKLTLVSKDINSNELLSLIEELRSIHELQE